MSTLDRQQPAAAWRRHGLLLLLTLLYVDTFVGRQIMAVMIEPIKQEFGVSDTAMGFISGLAFAGVFALIGLSAGQLADRVSRTRLLAACALLWSITTFFCGYAMGFYMLITARMLVAVAEAPISAASLSLISDLYPHHRRAFAISCYSAAPTFATILAMSLGAWLVETYGWRLGFNLIALPAIVIAAVFFLLIQEPVRGFWEQSTLSNTQTPRLNLRGSLKTLWQLPQYRLLVLSTAITTMGANAYGMWNATFLVRSHGLELPQAGLLVGMIGGGSAAVGMIFSGWLADHLIRKDAGWQLRLPLLGHGIGFVTMMAYLAWPTGVGLLVGDIQVPSAMLWCALNGFFAVWWVGPCFSFLTQIVPVQQRAVAIAFQTILITLLGIGIGPFLVGLLSDLMLPMMGTESLRYALVLIALSVILSMCLMSRIRHYSVHQGPPKG